MEPCPRIITIELRAASDTDSEFCYQLHKAAMGAYVTAIWGWDEQTQRDFHTRVFNSDRWKIITNGGEDIGRSSMYSRSTSAPMPSISGSA